jgi:Zn-dependent protease with chaperone function
MPQTPELDFQGFVARRRAEHDQGRSREAKRDYAYASDQKMREQFERMKPVELAVSAALRTYGKVYKGQLLGRAVRVSDRQFPRLQKLVSSCADTLEIPAPAVYIVNDPNLNAMTFGTDDEAFIMVHSALIDHFTDEELLTVLGHECGHVHNRHVVYLTTLHILTHVVGVVAQWASLPAVLALRAWFRRAEITCDRAGMLCGKSEPVAARALTKLALGSKRLYEEFNIEAFLEQHHENKDNVGRYMEVFATHPWLPKRVLAMRAFSESQMYREAAGVGEGGLTMPEVDERVSALLKWED